MAHDAIGAHARDELGFSPATAARPTQAALASAASFGVDAALPIGVVLIATPALLILGVSIASLVFLAGLGATSARGAVRQWARSLGLLYSGAPSRWPLRRALAPCSGLWPENLRFFVATPFRRSLEQLPHDPAQSPARGRRTGVLAS